jgi:hydrogenase nickel incorporation protein HypA/HybF
MHELSVCQSLLKTIGQTAQAHDADLVTRVYLSIGPLSGVEAPLLERAWTIAREGTIATTAELSISLIPVIVKCTVCGHEGEAKANSLVCGNCGDWRVTLVSGDEMLLTSLELEEQSASETAF